MQTFEAIESWPDDPAIEAVLWRGMNDEYYGAAQAAARALAKRYAGLPEMAERLCSLIAEPPSISAAAAALEALWRGWLHHPKTERVLNAARKSESFLIAITGVRGIIALGTRTGLRRRALCRGKRGPRSYSLMRQALFDQPSPGMKASFPRLLVRARGITEELRVWCRSETDGTKTYIVGDGG
jgi:hypothetical protein